MSPQNIRKNCSGFRNNTWMPSSEPFQWTPYSSGYHLALDQISFNGKDLFAGNLGEFKLDWPLVARVARVKNDAS
jgi:hypothetical protein